ncbi:MAG: 50S ribosomal protein L18 [Deltaproteobacteria bacterium]|jgi:large subunit ribosomal protein L18|nr:50S ribosomal protein L18 [Deltaproteobacteria bacterium]
MMQKKVTGRTRRKLRIRKKVYGTSTRPRLAVFRSSKHIYAQVIDDSQGKTIAHASSVTGPSASKVDSAKSVGSAVAKACIDKGVEQVVFDRGGYRYHGRVRALAESAREAGLKF